MTKAFLLSCVGSMGDLKSRQCAVRVLESVLKKGETVDGALVGNKDFESLSAVDRRFVSLLVLTTLRRMGQVDKLLATVIQKPLKGKNKTVLLILRLAVVQYVFLQTPAHAAVSTAVALTKVMGFPALSGFVNGVLRAVTRLKQPLNMGTEIDNLPDWLAMSWEREYGPIASLAKAVCQEPPLDVSVADNPQKWAGKWQGTVLDTGSVRVVGTSVSELEGFQTGRVWVQNAAASVPVQLFSDVRGKQVADLCAAPGGKTIQLVVRGAQVTACDISEKRLRRLQENLDRLGVRDLVSVRVGDVLQSEGVNQYDAVLLDAPCSATGTIARHPEIKYHRTAQDVLRLADIQKKLLYKAVQMTVPGGEIVFSTCSLQPEEGDDVVRSVLNVADVVEISDKRWQPYKTSFGSLRFLPSQGYDGFYVCLLRKK